MSSTWRMLTALDSTFWFAQQMLKKLSLNLHKPGWRDEGQLKLLSRLKEEVAELESAVLSGDGVVEEAADVACFAMMIADNWHQDRPTENKALRIADKIRDHFYEFDGLDAEQRLSIMGELMEQYDKFRGDTNG